MASTTRIKTSQSTTPYLRIAADEDYASSDVAHTSALTTGLGSSVDFEVHADGNTSWSTENSVTLSNTNITELAVSRASMVLLSIKNTGFKEAAKTNATTVVVKVFMDKNDVSKYFTLTAGESITLHGFGTGTDNPTDWALAAGASSGLYVEVTTCLTTND